MLSIIAATGAVAITIQSRRYTQSVVEHVPIHQAVQHLSGQTSACNTDRESGLDRGRYHSFFSDCDHDGTPDAVTTFDVQERTRVRCHKRRMDKKLCVLDNTIYKVDYTDRDYADYQ